MVSMKIPEIHTVLLILSRKVPEIFFRIFHPYLIPKNEAQKVKKRDLGIFQVENRDLGRPEGRGCGLNFFLAVSSHIRCNW